MKNYALSKKEKKTLFRIILSLFLFIIVLFLDKSLDFNQIFRSNLGFLFIFALYLSIYILIGYDVIKKAFLGIFHGQALDENFLMFIASIGAFILGLYKGFNNLAIEGFDEACAVLIFYQVGEFFQNYATNKSRKNISELMDLMPDYANKLIDGKLVRVSPNDVKVGDIIGVKPGEKVPLDGVIIKGSTSLDMRALTGESIPNFTKEEDLVLSGCVNLSDYVEIEVKKEFYDGTVNKILELVESASDKKSKTEKFISRFSRFYTPIVVLCAILLGIIPSIITSNWSVWLYRALNFLVVSCPCALVISVPLSFFAGIGVASKNKILVKGSEVLERLNNAKTFVFDKTGTITKGVFKVVKVYPEDKEEEILKLASIAEKNSNHPIAKSILSYFNSEVEENYSLHEYSGLGIKAEKEDDIILCGNSSLMEKFNIPFFSPIDKCGTVVYVAKDGNFIGYILISDEIKEDSEQTIRFLNNSGAKTIMLTGDREENSAHIAKLVGVTEYKSSLLPQDKARELEKILNENKKDSVCFVGDGINDAPSIMRADIGVAMGSGGVDAAIEASDVVLLQDKLSDLIKVKKIAKKTMRIVKQNVFLALFIKIGILISSSLGFTNMWIAVFGDVGVAVLAILNALRVGKNKY